ncbi:DUF5693 family protein [Aminivibrio sp.]
MKSKKMSPFTGKTVNPGLAVVVLLFLLSGVALLPRLRAEGENRSAAIVLDYRDVVSLAAKGNTPPGDLWTLLAGRGAGGMMVSELTGQDLEDGALPLYYGPASGLPEGVRKSAPADSSAPVLFFPKNFSRRKEQISYLSTRFPGTKTLEADGGTLALLPRSRQELLFTGFFPIWKALALGKARGSPVLPGRSRPSGDTRSALETSLAFSRRFLHPGHLPVGGCGPRISDLRPLARTITEKGRSVAMVEFSRQIGVAQLNWNAYPALLPLHSVTHEELLSRNISRSVLKERLLRAVKERSVRLLIFRPSTLETSENPLEAFLSEIDGLASTLRSHGITLAWPSPFAPWKTGLTGALALSLALVYSLLRYLQRFFLFRKKLESPDSSLTGRGMAMLLLLSAVLGAGIWLIPGAAKIAGALAAVFVVTEASFLALDGWRRPWAGLAGSFLFALAGGLAIAAFFSDPTYMLRLRSFSGVKATLFLPPLLVLLADLKNREHPESLGEIFRRPPLWGELFLLGMLLAVAGLVLFRSDNVQFVPAFEVRLRDFLERVLVARPRSKEIFLGYPSLLLWYYVRKGDLWPHWREIFRMGTVLGFSSAVNSFCHFHTPLYFILFRQFNGLWTGVLVGMGAIFLLRFVLLPLWNRFGRMVTE